MEEQTPPQEEKQIDVEKAFASLFGDSRSGSGEEELLRIASTYSRQITAGQIKILLYLEDWAARLKDRNPEMSLRFSQFVNQWLMYKQYNHSDIFIMKALEFISLRRFLNENSIKIDVAK